MSYSGTAAAPAKLPVCSSCGQPLYSPLPAADLLPTPEPSGLAGQPGPPAGLAPGTMLAGRYRIVSLLGRGGMGEVYRAEDLILEQSVALKFLPEALGRNPDGLARFHREVRLARQIAHANVCRVFDIGTGEGRCFIAMEFVDGENLELLLQRIGKLSGEKARDVALQICAGLAAAHDAGVLHRDLKPANIMLDHEGKVRITDFGLAILASDSARDASAGTPAYMSPEQLTRQTASPRSDIYALGLVLHEVFTGKKPFSRDVAGGLLRDPRKRLHLDMEGTGRAAQQAILSCLQAEAEKRPGSAREVAAGLAAHAAHHSRLREPAAVDEVNAARGARLAWSVLISTMFGLALLLLFSSQITGMRLDLADSRSAAASPAKVYAWFWCLGLQLFLGLSSMAWLVWTGQGGATSRWNATARLADAKDKESSPKVAWE